MDNFIAIDFETANAKRVSACSIGFAKVENRKILDSGQFLMKPVGGHAPFQSKIHGIKDEHTCNEPYFDEIFFKIENFFASPLIGHSCFDKQVLNALFSHFQIDVDFDYTDSCSVAKQQLPDLKNHKLKTLAKHFGIPSFKHHDAKEDAVACAQIFLNLQKNNISEPPPCPAEIGFLGFIRGILSDDEVNYKEAYELLYFLEDSKTLVGKYTHLYQELKAALDDDSLDDTESMEIKTILEGIVNS